MQGHDVRGYRVILLKYIDSAVDIIAKHKVDFTFNSVVFLTETDLSRSSISRIFFGNFFLTNFTKPFLEIYLWKLNFNFKRPRHIRASESLGQQSLQTFPWNVGRSRTLRMDKERFLLTVGGFIESLSYLYVSEVKV